MTLWRLAQTARAIANAIKNNRYAKQRIAANFLSYIPTGTAARTIAGRISFPISPSTASTARPARRSVRPEEHH